jgi:lipopolysaccharide/colanic/teichoic acid biosynthesis glycosyltransferase
VGGWYLASRTIIERVLALIVLLLTAPLLLAMAACVKLTSRGPALYAQIRVGKGGRPFVLYKLRTMTHNCEKNSGPRWSAPGDPRVTRLGRFLRRTHLDELPQLWNIVRGDMSWIGPRPERPEFLPVLERALPRYRQRLLVRPGVTGLAQVQLPADTDLHSVRRKLAYDLYYIRMLSPWIDLKILVCTGLHVLGVPYHFLRRVVFLPSPERVEDTYKDLTSDATLLRHAQSA